MTHPKTDKENNVDVKKMTHREKKELRERMKHLKSGKLEKRYARMGYIFMINVQYEKFIIKAHL